MAVLKRHVGDMVMANGKFGIVTGFWDESDPAEVTFPYYVLLAGKEEALLFAEHELDDGPGAGPENVWESMAYSYWRKWMETQDKLDKLLDKIKELMEDAVA